MNLHPGEKKRVNCPECKVELEITYAPRINDIAQRTLPGLAMIEKIPNQDIEFCPSCGEASL